jgi:methylenetetrahydrofolate reductase (NADPH)
MSNRSLELIPSRIAAGERSFSFEFFPPKTDMGEGRLWRTIQELEPLNPSFVSVTYGAGGSTRDRTIRMMQGIARETTFTAMAHLTCVGSTVPELREVIDDFAAAEISNILALRGDPPGGPDQPWQAHPEGLNHANELVTLVKSMGEFTVGVAAFPEGHPEAVDLDEDAESLLRKQQAGADFAVSQFFFDSADYFRLVERAESWGVTIPIIPGIMPVTDYKQIKRFAELSAAQFPPKIAAQFAAIADDSESVRALGVAQATQMCEELLSGHAPGLHFYTLNRSTATMEIYAELGLAHRFQAVTAQGR